ncbi:MAG: YcbK family protein [Desulfopila sp.]
MTTTWYRRGLGLLFFGLCLLTALPVPAQPPGRFFLTGSGQLNLINHRNDRQAKVELLNSDGTINEEALTRVDWVFGYPTSKYNDHMSLRMLFMLSYFADMAAPGQVIHIESGYRSPEYNKAIRQQGANAARTSTHIDGMALDFWLAGVDGKELWETVRARDCCGVGHYGGKTIHLDAGRPRFWEAATSGTGSTEPDNNRHIYLNTTYDRYQPGEKLSLMLSGISSFSFGVENEVTLHPAVHPETVAARLPLHSAPKDRCLPIGDRETSRSLTAALPPSLPAGRYTVEVAFCQKPFKEMPEKAISRTIEVVATP